MADDFTEDRIQCLSCRNLQGHYCGKQKYYPVIELRRRCEDYKPKTDDHNQQTARERWPGLWM